MHHHGYLLGNYELRHYKKNNNEEFLNLIFQRPTLKTYAIKTFGCSMNYSDTERVASVLESQGLFEVEDLLDADIAILTTCSVKQKAEDKVFSTINNIHKNRKKKKKDVKIVLTGCMVRKSSSQADEEKDVLLPRIPEIDMVFRIEDTALLPQLLGLGKSKMETSYLNIIPKYKSQFQAMVPIQTGCDNFCTYCIVPFTRGREQSRPMDDIIREITMLAKRGLKEVILVGQNVNSYGKGLPETKRKFDEENFTWMDGEDKTPFTVLLERVNEIPGIERIRFQSSNPHDMTDDMIKAIATLPKVMPSLHLALQSGDDQVLKRMNRRHTYAQYKAIVDKLRAYNPLFSITTDIIVGFCGETEEEFQNSMKAITEIDTDLIYISQYSVRKGTPAEKSMIDDVSAEVKKDRWHRMNNWLKSHVHAKMKSLIGTTQKVLIENIQEGLAEGKDEYNRACQVQLSSDTQVGDTVEMKVDSISTWSMRGRQLVS